MNQEEIDRAQEARNGMQLRLIGDNDPSEWIDRHAENFARFYDELVEAGERDRLWSAIENGDPDGAEMLAQRFAEYERHADTTLH